MVLTKRKRDGEFIAWNPAGQAPAPSTPSDLPTAKKPRTKSTTEHSPPRTTRSSTKASHALASYSTTSAAQTTSYAPPTMPVQVAHPSRPTRAYPEPGPSQPPKPSRSRKKADTDQPPTEKRGAIFKKSCPKNILDRVERVMSQRFFMIDRQRTPGDLKEVFSVLGSTGNVYTVTIDHKPSCNCPDALKGNHCKHIVILQVNQASGVWYQKALLTSELETIFAEAPLAPNSVAHARIRDAHAKATGKATNKHSIANQEAHPSMHGVNEIMLVFCEDCGNALHKVCFQQWKDTAAKSHQELTCVWCRARWVSAAAPGADAGAAARRTSDGYLNLSGVSGLSPVRDTSTYYHGPRRGYGYSAYRSYLD
ncbi:hypothetical protein FPV67DRAFT_1488842 [Lyophyllum atratum]|nr:hypothetical protein FPV67DRAFT_1488842 [Lyophyllum atratum]